MTDAAIPLNQWPYLNRSQLQYRQQLQLLGQQYPTLKSLIDLYQKAYPLVTSAMALSLKERPDLSDSQLTYGETDWLTFIRLMEPLQPQPRDCLIELGCGTGVLCLMATLLWPTKAIGIEYLPGFVAQAKQMADSLKMAERLTFLQQDLFTADISMGTIFYVTATCFPAPQRQRLAQKLLMAPPQAKVLSVSLPLEAAWLEEKDCLSATFSWGPDRVYVYRRVD